MVQPSERYESCISLKWWGHPGEMTPGHHRNDGPIMLEMAGFRAENDPGPFNKWPAPISYVIGDHLIACRRSFDA
jgi:hypothetical protein